MANQQKKVAKSLNADQVKALNALTTVSEQIRYLDKAGWTTGDISRTLSAHLGRYVRYQWVNNVLTAAKLAKQYQK